MTSVSDIPTGAIENGRVFLQRLADHYDFNCEAGSLANCTDYHEAVRCFEFIAQWISELPAAPFLQGVKVKELEWHKSHMSAWNGDYHTLPTAYTVRLADENGWKWSGFGGHGYANSPEAAKAAAQADYEARILSAIETVIPVSSPSPRAQALEEEEFAIDKLRFRAFHTNSDADRQAYFDAVSKWFQDRHYRRMDAERALSSQPVADGPERGKFYHKHWELSKLLEARNGGLVDHSGGEAWRYEYTSKDEHGKYDMLYRHNVNASVPARLTASPGASE